MPDGHLKHGADGHLMFNSGGHLVNECGDGETIPTCFICKSVETWAVDPFVPSVDQLRDTGNGGFRWGAPGHSDIAYIDLFNPADIDYPYIERTTVPGYETFHFGNRKYFTWDVDENGIRTSDITETSDPDAARLKFWWRHRVEIPTSCDEFNFGAISFFSFETKATPGGGWAEESFAALPDTYSTGPTWTGDVEIDAFGNYWYAQDGTAISINETRHNYFPGLGYYEDGYYGDPAHFISAYLADRNATMGTTIISCRDETGNCTSGTADDEGNCV